MYGGYPRVSHMTPTATSESVNAELSGRQTSAAMMHGLQGTRFVQGLSGWDLCIANPTMPPVQIVLTQNNGDRQIFGGGAATSNPTRLPAAARRFYGL